MKCSKCGNEFEGRFCPNCGLPAYQPVDRTIQQDYPKTTAHPFWDKIVTCKTCGKQIAKTAKRCPFCGARQHQGALTACYLIILAFIIGMIFLLFF